MINTNDIKGNPSMLWKDYLPLIVSGVKIVSIKNALNICRMLKGISIEFVDGVGLSETPDFKFTVKNKKSLIDGCSIEVILRTNLMVVNVTTASKAKCTCQIQSLNDFKTFSLIVAGTYRPLKKVSDYHVLEALSNFSEVK